MVKIDSKVLAKLIDRYCKLNDISKGEFNKQSRISSATLTQWRQGAEVSAKSIDKLEEYTGISIEEFYAEYGDEKSSEADAIEIREMLRTRPEAKILFDTVKDAPASVLLEVAARIMRMKEESERQ